MAVYQVIHTPCQYCDQSAINDVVAYCLQERKTPQNLIFAHGVDPQYAASEMHDVAAVYGKDSGLRLRHSVLSFAPNENISAAEAAEIAQEAIDFYGDNYQIVSAVHEDTDDIHIHIVMNKISFVDGSRYRGKKSDYYQYQKHLKSILSANGIHKLIMD